MLTEERHRYILNELHQKNVIKAQDIISALHASESTIRRDFQILEDKGQLTRVHGGAKKVSSSLEEEEPTMTEKVAKNAHEKEKIGQLAANFVQLDDIIFLDAGTSTLAMIPFLADKSTIMVVTNGVIHASLLADLNIKTFLIGGQLKLTTKAIVGTTSVAEIAKCHFDKVFLGMNGVHATDGYTTPDIEEATIKQTALEHGSETFVLADDSKLGKRSFAKVADLRQATLLTNLLATEQRALYATQTTVKEC